MKKIYLGFMVISSLLSPAILMAQGTQMKTTDSDVLTMEANRKTTAPFSILFKENSSFRSTDAQQLFNKYLGAKTGIDNMVLKVHDESRKTIVVDRYQQFFKGIKVETGNYIVTSKNGVVSFITGDFFTIDPSTSIVPALTEQAARTKAWMYVDGKVPANPENFPAELVFAENGLAPIADGKVHLAYKIFITSQTKALTMEDVYVDANTGEVLYTSLQIMAGCYKPDEKRKLNTTLTVKNDDALCLQQNEVSNNVVAGTAATIYSGNVTNMVTKLVSGSYRLEAVIPSEPYPNHTRSVNHALVSGFTTIGQFNTAIAASTEVTDLDNNWTAAEFDNANRDNTAFDVHWGAQRVYEYWNTRHGRLSWNGTNGILNCFVHGDVNWNNAFWQGSGGINSMFYGDGSNTNGGFSTLSALDVTGHEIGHGVCQATANLTYSKESGGMNEGFSDIWGASIEHFADPHETDAVPKSYFDIGEEIGLPYPNNPLRSMSNPKAFGQPDTYLGVNWVSTTTPTDVGGDNWGVHTNSGVLNHWFYLLVSGGNGVNDNGNNFGVPAIGWVDAEKIAFLAETNLTASSNYAAMRTASINAATTLFGTCTPQVEAVTRAWYAVGVGAEYVPCVPQIGFKDVAITTSEASGLTTCPATKTITVRMSVQGPAPTGGNSTAIVTATGTAVSGKDFTIGTGTATFTAGSLTDQNVTINIIDDAAVESTETIRLDFTFNANGSTATKSTAFNYSTITITDDDVAPEFGGTNSNSTYIGSYTVNLGASSPFKSATATGKAQYLYTAAELTAAGVKPNVPITTVVLNVVTKSSIVPFTGFTVSYANTALTSLATFSAGLSTVYSGNYSTVSGQNNITLNTPFTWDGTSNLIMQYCFSNAAAGSANDIIAGIGSTFTSTIGATGAAATDGCTLAAATTSTSRPLMAFFQTTVPGNIESTVSSTRNAQVFANSNSYFYSTADNEIIAGIKNNSLDLGCTVATVTSTGTTWQAFPSGGFRSQKAIQVTPSTNVATTSYTGTFYFSVAELGGRLASAVKLYKTTASTVAGATAANTVAATAVGSTLNTNGTWYEFTGNFTGFSTFFLGDAFIVLPVSIVNFNAAKVGNNAAKLTWEVAQETNISRYILEHSQDNISFSQFGDVNSRNASSANYNFNDLAPFAGINYYRLKIIGNDGHITYSSTIKLDFNNKQKLIVAPNPVTDNFTIQYNNNNTVLSLSVIDMTGKKLKEFAPNNTAGSILVDAKNYAAGVYIILMVDKDNKITTQRIVKQ